jgi:RNA-directed DNA polymerase
MEEMNYYDTEEGTPQGGIFSPLLCNVALNGMEEMIGKTYPQRRGISPGIHVIRYADDLVVTGKNQDILKGIRRKLETFLHPRGLKLSEKKTKITHIGEGFDFLGFHLRRMKRNLHLNRAGTQETVLIIKPSQKGVKKLKRNICKIINPNKPLPKIISEINPILRG